MIDPELEDDVREALLAERERPAVLNEEGKRRVLARLVRGFATGGHGQGALELPLGVLGDAVVGVSLLGLRATVLDAALRARELVHAA